MTKKLEIDKFLRQHNLDNLRINGHRVVVLKHAQIQLLKYTSGAFYYIKTDVATVTQNFLLPPQTKISLLISGKIRIRIPNSLSDDRPKYIFNTDPTNVVLFME